MDSVTAISSVRVHHLNTSLLTLLCVELLYPPLLAERSVLLLLSFLIFQLICISPVGRASGRRATVWGLFFRRSRSDSNESPRPIVEVCNDDRPFISGFFWDL